MIDRSRVLSPALRSRIVSAAQAVQFIRHGDNVGMSGFTGAAYPKAVPAALAQRIEAAHAAGDAFKVGIWTGASTAPELDGALAKVDGVEMRLPYPAKIVAIVETHSPDRNSAFAVPDQVSQRIAGHILEFLAHEVRKGRLPANLLPIQSGVGNTANAVLAGLDAGPFENLSAYTEVLQDGMLDMLRSGTLG